MEDKSWEIKIDYTPIAKARARIFKDKRGKIRGVDLQSKEKYAFELIIKGNKPPYFETEPIGAILEFGVQPNKNIKNKKLYNFVYPTKRPDLDNYIKFILDCCNNIVWKDDSQIIKIEAMKIYSENPYIKIKFYEINAYDIDILRLDFMKYSKIDNFLTKELKNIKDLLADIKNIDDNYEINIFFNANPSIFIYKKSTKDLIYQGHTSIKETKQIKKEIFDLFSLKE